jgi:NAD(P)H dehydrogenase (quinone)
MFAISGASGNLGRATALRAAELLQLTEGGAADGLILASRSPDELRGSVPGASTRSADFDRPDTLWEAFAGASRLLLISTDRVDNRSRQHAAAIDAARDAGVGHIIYTSMLSPGPENPALISESHWATEEHLRASGLAYTLLRFSLYSDFQVFEAADALASGRFVHNRGAGGCSYIARSDCAMVAAAVLCGDGHEGATYELTGPESLDAEQLAALYADAGGRPVEAVPVSDDELLASLAGDTSADGHVQYGAALTISLGRAIREDRFSTVSTTVEQLTGSRPRTVADLLSASAEFLQSR